MGRPGARSPAAPPEARSGRRGERHPPGSKPLPGEVDHEEERAPRDVCRDSRRNHVELAEPAREQRAVKHGAVRRTGEPNQARVDVAVLEDFCVDKDEVERCEERPDGEEDGPGLSDARPSSYKNAGDQEPQGVRGE